MTEAAKHVRVVIADDDADMRMLVEKRSERPASSSLQQPLTESKHGSGRATTRPTSLCSTSLCRG
jgi:hypothetical protein